MAQVYALADAVGLRYRALILLAAVTSLRRAELAALTPAAIDLDVRVVAFPELIALDVRNQLTANAGANLRELMARMGHDSERGALIYLHSTA